MKKINKEMLEIILIEIKDNSKVTELTLANKYGYTERTIRRYFKILKDSGKIKLIDTGKKRAWKIE